MKIVQFRLIKSVLRLFTALKQINGMNRQNVDEFLWNEAKRVIHENTSETRVGVPAFWGLNVLAAPLF